MTDEINKPLDLPRLMVEAMREMHCDTGTVVQKGDCALIIKPGGEPQLLVPHMKEDDFVPDHVLFLTAIMVRLTEDPEFAEEQLDWMASSLSS